MKLADAVQKAVEIYRQNPTLDAKLGKQRRGELRGVIGCVASQGHLQRTISDMRFAGYQENSPAIRLFYNRLSEVEAQLKQFEVAYGSITKLPYLT